MLNLDDIFFEQSDKKPPENEDSDANPTTKFQNDWDEALRYLKKDPRDINYNLFDRGLDRGMREDFEPHRPQNFPIKENLIKNNNNYYKLRNLYEHLEEQYNRPLNHNPFNLNFNWRELDGGLSERLGHFFEGADIEGITVELVPFTDEEEATLREAYEAHRVRQVEKIAKAYTKETGEELDKTQVMMVRQYLMLLEQQNKKLNLEDLLRDLKTSQLRDEVCQLLNERPFSAEQLANIHEAARKRKPSPADQRVFGKKNRRYFRIKTSGESKTQHRIEDALQAKGYTILDYHAGYATQSDPDRAGKTKIKIGKLLKGDEDLLKGFADDPIRVVDNLMVVMSRDANDIARMSTNRNWRSCMASDRENFRYVYDDIREGTVVAYLTSMTDPDANSPLARVSLKPFRKEFAASSALDPKNSTILRPGPSYGLPNALFYLAVQRYAQEMINAGQIGTYRLAGNLYQDRMKETVRRSAVNAQPQPEPAAC